MMTLLDIIDPSTLKERYADGTTVTIGDSLYVVDIGAFTQPRGCDEYHSQIQVPATWRTYLDTMTSIDEYGCVISVIDDCTLNGVCDIAIWRR